MTDVSPHPQRTLATRGGGIGAPLPRNTTRKTARKGVAPVALPSAWFTAPATASVIDDIAEYVRLGVKPREVLREWISVDPHLARRHQPEFWLRIKGIDLASIVGEVIGPIFSIPSPPGSPTYGITLLRLDAEVHWQDSPVYALFKFRRGWPKVKITIEGIEHARNKYDVQMAERGRQLAQDIALRGKTPVGREQELDRLARLGLIWTQAPGRGRSPEDLTWPIIAQADRGRDPKKVQAQAGKRGISIDDVCQRAAELS